MKYILQLYRVVHIVQLQYRELLAEIYRFESLYTEARKKERQLIEAAE